MGASAARTASASGLIADAAKAAATPQGISTRIGRALFVSEATVKTHVNRIFAKTGSRDRGQATRYAYTHGYADPPAPAR